MHADVPELIRLITTYKSKEADALFERIATALANDRDQTIESMRAIGDDAYAKYHSDWGARAYLAAIAAAWGTSGAPTGDDLAIELGAKIADKYDDKGSAALDTAIASRAFVPARELALRLALARSRAVDFYRLGTTNNLRRLAQLATTDRDQLWVAGRLANQLHGRIENIERAERDERETTPEEEAAVRAEHAAVLARCLSLANKLASANDRETMDAVVQADIEISRADPILAHRHATRAEQLAHESADAHLRARAIRQLAELLLEAEMFDRADDVASKLVEGAGSDDDDEADREVDTPALLEEIRRKRGVLPEPSPLAFIPAADADDYDRYGTFDELELPEDFAKYFQRSDKTVTAVKRLVTRKTIVSTWSNGLVRTATELDSQRIFGPVRSFACECGRYLGTKWAGEDCERCGVAVASNEVRKWRTAHLKLRSKVVHPWHVSTVAKLFHRQESAIESADPATLAREIDQLIETDGKTYRYTRWPREHPGRDALGELQVNNLDSSALVIDVVPVWPPDAPKLRGRDSVKQAYVRVLEDPDVRGAVRELFDTIAERVR